MTTVKQRDIYCEIIEERIRQDDKWGGSAYDDNHNTHDWLAYLVKHAGKAVAPRTNTTFRQQMVRVAALAVAAIEWYDRNSK